MSCPAAWWGSEGHQSAGRAGERAVDVGKDLEDLRAGLAAGVDYVALSFVRSADDVLALRERMGARRVPIIAKIEKPEAVQDIDAILDVANGIMVARGDLGVEMSLEMVPPIQKRLIRQARRRTGS